MTKFEAKYKIRVSALNQGDRISVPDLERILGCSSQSAEFVKKRHFFNEQLQKALWKIDRKWVTIVEKDEVCVLTDMEASVYEERQARLATDKHKRAFREMKAVNRSRLTAQRRREHDQELIIQGLELQGLKAVRRNPPPPQQAQQIVPPDRPGGPFRNRPGYIRDPEKDRPSPPTE